MKRNLSAGLLIAFLAASWLGAADWPMWRFDSGRTASGTEELPPPQELSPLWERTFSPREMVWDDPLNHDLMPFDRVFEPIVHRGVMVLGFNDRDKVAGYDASTGRLLWTFYAGGPVRMAPAASGGKLFFTSDDGHLYCLSVSDGAFLWKRRGGPSGKMILGNKRMVSTWPARGGAVIKDGTVYWAAGIWPFMGTFIYATEVESGETRWLNDETGPSYILQPHNSPAFAGVAPQGNLAVSGNRLLVPGGRSVPAALDIHTGREIYFRLADNGKNGGAFVCADEQVFFNHNRDRMVHMFNSANGDLLEKDLGGYPVVSGSKIYFSGPSVKIAETSSPGRIYREIEADAGGDLIRSGSRLYAGGKRGITIISAPRDGEERIAGFISVKGGVERLLAADHKLFAVSLDGTIRAFGESGGAPLKPAEDPQSITVSRETSKQAETILAATGKEAGWAVLYGSGNGQLPAALAELSSLNIIVLENDAGVVQKLRKNYDEAGIPAKQVAFICTPDAAGILPPYFASLSIVVGDAIFEGIDDTEITRLVHRSMRPFGGALWITGQAENARNAFSSARTRELEGLARITESGPSNELLFVRKGAPEGSDNWTQQYGSIANTVKSDDELVQLPLGLLWFGGNSNMDVLPRHGHGPPEQVVDGRLIIEGMDSISCRDVYTGRVVWKTEFTTLSTFDQYYDESYADLPLANHYYNQEHLPGANSRGTNFVATRDEVFVAQGTHVHILDMKTGKIIKSVKNETNSRVGFIGSYQGKLITGTEFASYSGMITRPSSRTAGLQPLKPGAERRVERFTDYDITASAGLALYDNQENLLWHKTAEYGFIHNSITAGNNRLYLIDSIPPAMQNTLGRRGIKVSQSPVLMALDPDSGEIIWKREKGVFGSWLGYSEEHDLLLQATRPSRDMISGEEGTRMTVHDARTGEVIWDRDLKYANPPIIHGDRIIVENRGFNLLTGEPMLRKNPITGEEQQWTYTREYGCNYNIASEHLLSFRSASAGFYDLDSWGGTGNFGGFKSGCTSNLVAANGVLNAPDYTRTCSCSYQNQTSLALVHMPELEYWTTNDFEWPGGNVESLGINLGAPGDRVDDDGTLWLEYPSVGGPSPELPLRIKDEQKTGRILHHSLRMAGGSLPWVSASALQGITELSLRVAGQEEPDREYSVTLLFAELEPGVEVEDRVIDVYVQGEMVRKGFDILRETGGPMRETSLKLPRVRSGNGILTVSLEAHRGSLPPVLSGVRIEALEAVIDYAEIKLNKEN